jgi:Right handed beta helix region
MSPALSPRSVVVLGFWLGASACTDGLPPTSAPSLPDASADDLAPDLHVKRGQRYVVRPSGDDHNSGKSASLAWQTIDRVNQQAFEPGDSIAFEGGFSYRGNLRFDARDAGRYDAPIHVGSLAAVRATIEAGDGSALEISDSGGFVVEDLILHGDWDADSQSGNHGEGLGAVNDLGGGKQLSFLRFRRLEVSGFQSAGIALHATPPDDSKNAGFRDVEISDCQVHDNADFGVTSDGPFAQDAVGYSHSDLRLRGLEVWNQRGLRNKGSHTGSGIILSDVDGALVEDSLAYGNGEFNDHPGGGGFGIWAWDSRHVLIAHNESYANKTSTSDGGGFDLDGGVTASVIQYNYSHDNQGAGYGAFQFQYARPYAQNVVRYNISQNDGQAFLFWDGNGDMGSLDAYQNVAYGPNPMVASYSALAAVRMFNNVFFGVGESLLDVYDASGLVLSGNDYWTGDAAFAIHWDSGGATPRTFSDFESYRDATGQEASGRHVDPQLMAAGAGPTLHDTGLLETLDMYTLQADSPLIDQGVDLRDNGIEPGERDFFGNPSESGAGFDIGAYERP